MWRGAFRLRSLRPPVPRAFTPWSPPPPTRARVQVSAIELDQIVLVNSRELAAANNNNNRSSQRRQQSSSTTPPPSPKRSGSSGSSGQDNERPPKQAPPSSPSLLARYNALLEEHPLRTKAITSMCLVALGDVASQVFFTDGPLDVVRLLRMGVVGGVLVGPTLHFWYATLYRLVPSPGLPSVFGRMLLDQVPFAMSFIVVFMACVLLLEGRINKLPSTLHDQYWDSCLTNWTIWIPAQLLNFWIVPRPYQVLFANCVGFVWNTYLSWAAHLQESRQGDQRDS